MSAQFGRWNFAGESLTLDYVEKVIAILSPYGPDGSGYFSRDGVNIIHRAFHTTAEAHSEAQPRVSASGVVLTWDGRLDNRVELVRDLRDGLADTPTDVDIVVAAYERWGTESFARLVGDWALAVWNPNARSLILAKDFMGTRPLYYSSDKDQISWSTILDPLVLFAEKYFSLCEEYVAGWFSLFPAAHLTPYVGIHSVPPSCFVRFERGRTTVSRYWDFDPAMRIRYRTDAEYEEQFRAIFAESVRRRLRSDAPILAELSGGIDSSSIVCMADTIIARAAGAFPRLDTLSYYNESEPHWNERPYFTRVEEKRGRSGCHIDVGAPESFPFEVEGGIFASIPGSGAGHRTEPSRQFAACIESHGNRVVLSGIGGDEVAGGVPTPTPELMDLLASARFKELARKLKLWAINRRKPWFHLLMEAARGFFPPAVAGIPKSLRPADWLNPRFVRSHRAALTGYPTRVKFFGSLPNLQENVSALNVLRRQLACSVLSSDPPYEKRYPYLDRDLLEFMYAIPRDQLVRPGQRRSLVRRALVGIVPDELLNRRRKAFVVRSPMAAISRESSSLIEMSHQMLTTSLGIVDADAFRQAVHSARRGQEIRTVTMNRTLEIEFWLRTIRDCGVLISGHQPRPTSLHLAKHDVVRASHAPSKSSAS
jgi:asparagine synthase (glutamine-hydrolysing)